MTVELDIAQTNELAVTLTRGDTTELALAPAQVLDVSLLAGDTTGLALVPAQNLQITLGDDDGNSISAVFLPFYKGDKGDPGSLTDADRQLLDGTLAAAANVESIAAAVTAKLAAATQLAEKTGTAAQKAEDLIDGFTVDASDIQGYILEQQLSESLLGRIALVDAPEDVAGSVAFKLAAETAARTTALADAAKAQAEAIAAEAAVRSAAIVEEANTRADALADEAEKRGAALTTERTRAQDAESSLSTSIDTLTASLNGLSAGLQTEQTARVDADSAEASERTTLAARLGSTGDVGRAIATAQSTADSAVSANSATASRVDTLSSGLGTTNANLQTEQTARSNADGALSIRIDTLNAAVGGNTASVTSEAKARADADTALSSRVDTVSATTAGNTAAISAETTARTAADSALSTRIDAVVATTGNNTAAVTAEQTARTSADSALSSRLDTVLAVANASFDAAVQWNFDTDGDTQGWFVEGGCSLSAAGGWLTVTSNNGDPYFRSSNFSINGALYPLVRVRVKRVAGSGWDGGCFYGTSAHGEDGNYVQRAAMPSALQTVGGVAVIEFDMSAIADWKSNTIQFIRLDLGNSAADVFAIDWIAVGRQAPGASTAALQTEQTARANADSANAQSIQTVSSSFNTLSGNLGPVKNWILGSWGNGSSGWAGIRAPLGAVQLSVGRSWGIITFGADGSPSVSTHDVFANGAPTNNASFAAALNALPYGTHVAVVTCDEPQSCRSDDMHAALKRCGATQAMLDAIQYRGAYMLIGIAGAGEGGGDERVTPTGGAADSWLQLPIQVCGSKVVGLGGNAGALRSSQAYVQSYSYSKAQADSAIASSVSNVSARLNDGGDIKSALVQVASTANTTAAAVSGTWGVTLDVNGKVSGLKYYSDGHTSGFTISADKVLIGDFTNLIAGPSSTGESIDGWNGVNSLDWGAVASNNWWMNAGVASRYAIGFYHRDTEYGNLFTVKPGDKFYVSMDTVCAGAGTSTVNFSIGLHVLSPSGVHNWIAGASRGSAAGLASIGGVVTVPDGFSKAIVWVQLDMDGGLSLTEADVGKFHYATNVTVRRMNGAELIVDGAVTANKINVTSLSALTSTMGLLHINDWLYLDGGSGDGGFGGIRTTGKTWAGDGVDGFVCYRGSAGGTYFEVKAGNNAWEMIWDKANGVSYCAINWNNNFIVDNAGNVTANSIKARGDVEATTLKADTIMVASGNLALEAASAARSSHLASADYSYSGAAGSQVIAVQYMPTANMHMTTWTISFSGYTTGSTSPNLCVYDGSGAKVGTVICNSPVTAVDGRKVFSAFSSGTTDGGPRDALFLRDTGSTAFHLVQCDIVAINTR